MATLFIVGTPLGNLEDMTLRALRVLREVNLVAAEDTRTTGRLLRHYGIDKPLVTYTDAYGPKEATRRRQVMEALGAGQDVALVSDAGMPGLSDPGVGLVRAVLEAGHELVVVPGPSALTTALVVSGLATDRFLFVGFLPRKAEPRKALLAELMEEPATLVAFETPHRLAAALADIAEVLGDRPVAVARELTKRYEEVWRGSAAEAARHFAAHPAKGEITLVIAGVDRSREANRWPAQQVTRAVELLQGEGLAPAAVARVVSRLSGWHRGDVYELLTKRS